MATCIVRKHKQLLISFILGFVLGWGDSWQETKAISVDNGTAAWGKPMETAGGWGEQNSDVTSSSWGHTPIGQQVPGKPGMYFMDCMFFQCIKNSPLTDFICT